MDNANDNEVHVDAKVRVSQGARTTAPLTFSIMMHSFSHFPNHFHSSLTETGTFLSAFLNSCLPDINLTLSLRLKVALTANLVLMFDIER